MISGQAANTNELPALGGVLVGFAWKVARVKPSKGNRMRITNWMLLVGVCCSTTLAEPISVSGVVLDKETKAPIKDVVVKLQTRGFSDTTDATGKFTILGATIGLDRSNQHGPAPMLMADGRIALSVTEASMVTLQTFSTQGKLLASVHERMAAGSYRLDAMVARPGTYFHKIQIGAQAPTILKQSSYSALGKAGVASSDLSGFGVAGRTLAEVFQDTVVATLSGYTTAKVAINATTVGNLEVLLAKVPTPPGTITKARVINTTDLYADPDDEQSLVHMFVTSNEVDIEGLIVSTSCWRKTQSSTAPMTKFLTAYEQAYPNLKVHSPDFKTPAYYKSITTLGQKGYSMGDVGNGKDSPGSELIIKAVDKDDPRPVWINFWGGGNTLAQAITKVKNTRTKAQLDQFLGKIRVFDILGQDETGAWLTKNYPNVLYIRATGVYGWQYSASWMASNIQSKGPLGKVYPNTKYETEGDTPAFLHQLANGLNDPEKVDQGGWGGRFGPAKKANIKSMSPVTGEGAFQPYYMYGNTSDGSAAIKRWYDGYANNFAARMLWSVTPSYSGANHHPIAIVNGDKTRNVLYVTAKAGSNVVLDGAGSSDPDKNNLVWSWALYADPSTEKTATISGGNSSKATVKAPAAGKNLHIVLTLKDNGAPALTAYRRVVITGN